MKLLQTIKIPEDFILYLERLNYEVNSYQSLLTYAINNDLYNTATFEEYNKKYIEAFIEYDLAKEELKANFIPKELNNYIWEVSFVENILYIYEG